MNYIPKILGAFGSSNLQLLIVSTPAKCIVWNVRQEGSESWLKAWTYYSDVDDHPGVDTELIVRFGVLGYELI